MGPLLLGALIGAGLGAVKGHQAKQAAKKENLSKAFLNLGGARYVQTPNPSVIGSMISGGATGALLGALTGGAGTEAAATGSTAADLSGTGVMPSMDATDASVLGRTEGFSGGLNVAPYEPMTSIGSPSLKDLGMSSSIHPKIMDAGSGWSGMSNAAQGINRGPQSISIGDIVKDAATPSNSSIASGASKNLLSDVDLNGLGKNAMNLLKDPDFQRTGALLMAADMMKGDDKKDTESAPQTVEKTPIYNTGSDQNALANLILALQQNKGGANRV